MRRPGDDRRRRRRRRRQRLGAVDRDGDARSLRRREDRAGCTAAPSDTTPPSTPAGVSVSGVSQTAVTLSWSPSTDDVGVAGYRAAHVTARRSGASPGTNFTFTGLLCATTYTLGVVAFDAAGKVSALAIVERRDAGLAPATRRHLRHRAASPRAPSARPRRRSRGRRRPTTPAWPGTGCSRAARRSEPRRPTSFDYTGLTCATTYTLGVAAVDAAGNVSGTASERSASAAAACPDTTPPSTPTGLATNSVGQTSVALSWTASTDDVGVTGYRTVP